MKLVSSFRGNFLDQFHKSPDCVIPVCSQLSSATFPLFTFWHILVAMETKMTVAAAAESTVHLYCNGRRVSACVKDNMVAIVFDLLLLEALYGTKYIVEKVHSVPSHPNFHH